MNIQTYSGRTSFDIIIQEWNTKIVDDISWYNPEEWFFVDWVYYDKFFDLLYEIARWNKDDIETVLSDLIKKNLDSKEIETLITNLK